MKRNIQNIVTLVSRNTAKVGYRFIFKENIKCKQCRQFNICSKLKTGRIYEVVKIIKSNTKLNCLLTNELMQPVEVRLSVIKTSIRGGGPFDTEVIMHWHKIDCEHMKCKYRKLCFPIGLKDGDRIKIKNIAGKLRCPLHFNLLEIDVELV